MSSAAWRSCDVAVGHVLAAVGVGGCFDLCVGDRGQAELLEDGLERAGGLVADRDDLVLPDRVQPAVDLQVALQDQVVVVVVQSCVEPANMLS